MGKAKSRKKTKNPVIGKRITGKKSGSRQAQRPNRKRDSKKKTVAKITTEKKSLIQRLIEALKQRIKQKKAEEKQFPKKFPFWARLKISKKRTTLVIDEEEAYNKKKKRMEPGFVHREAIHPNKDGSNVKGYEQIKPNPDPKDSKPMYLKRPTKLPQRLFEPHNKELNMPEALRLKYEKNNKNEQ